MPREKFLNSFLARAGFARYLFAGAWLICSASAAQAGTIVVEVELSASTPFARAPVVLHEIVESGTESGQVRGRSFGGFTDRQGVANFHGLPAGRYTVSIPQLPARVLSPSENPLAPAPVLTLFERGETLRTRVMLEYGLPIGVELESPVLPSTPFVVHFRHRATGFIRSEEVNTVIPRLTRLLAGGLWDVWVTAPPGHLLVDVRRGREHFQGYSAFLELATPRTSRAFSTSWLRFRYDVPSAIEGTVVATGGTLQEIVVEATLQRAGDWLAEAQHRGGSIISPLTVSLEPDGSFRLDLPDGVWQVRPLGRRVLASDPPSAVVELRPQETVDLEFEVELDDRPRQTLRVWVRNVDGGNVEGASVRLIGSGGWTENGVTGAAGVDLEVGPRGDYVLYAGHPDYLEGVLELPDLHAEETAEVSLELANGGELFLSARDLEGAPAAGVEWEIEALEAPELRFDDTGFRAAKSSRRAVTDQSGRVQVRGLYDGFYRLSAQRPAQGDPAGPEGHGTPGGLFRVGRNLEYLEPSLDLYVSSDEGSQAWARQVPAANLRFHVFCDDGGKVPSEASVLAIDLDGPIEDMAAARAAAVLVLDDLPLAGRRQDVLFAGPLDQGVYRLAMLPRTFERWSWYAGPRTATSGAESFPIQIDIDEKEPGAILDVGSFELTCQPAVMLRPAVGHSSLPDLRLARVRARVLHVDVEREIAAPPRPALWPDRIELEGVPTGPSRLDLVVRHRHFLPEPEIHWQVQLDLRRGSSTTLTPRLPAVGGALLVQGLKPGTRVQLTGEGARLTEVEVSKGWVLVPSLEPGRRTVTWCSDTECAEPLDAWSNVEIRRGQTTRLSGRAVAR